jgi:hypothetical protein
MSKRDSTPIRRAATSIPNPATTAEPSPNNEAPWQQLMVFNYILFEAIDAMEQERATGRHTPLNQSWQQFVHHLRLKKPRLSACLDKLLRDGLLDEQGGPQ